MKKNFSCLLITIISTSSIASASLPIPDGGIQYVNLDEMNLPDGFKADILRRQKAERTKGYFSTFSETAYFLLQLDNHATTEINKFSHSVNAMDTHLKSHWKTIPLTFKFHAIYPLSNDSIIGYAPLGTFIDDPHHTSSGHWSGIKVFFNNNDLGTCEYSYLDLKATHGSVQLSKETTEQLVNQQPSSKTVEGNKDSGYLYEVSWFASFKMQQLSCAKPIFERDLMAKVLELASHIDKNTRSFQANTSTHH